MDCARQGLVKVVLPSEGNATERAGRRRVKAQGPLMVQASSGNPPLATRRGEAADRPRVFLRDR